MIKDEIYVTCIVLDCIIKAHEENMKALTHSMFYKISNGMPNGKENKMVECLSHIFTLFWLGRGL